MHGTQSLTSILHDPKPMPLGKPLKRRHIRGVAENMHRQERPSALSNGRLGGLWIQVERNRINIRENRPSTLVERNIRGGNKRERTSNHLIAITNPHSTQGKMQPSGATRNSRRNPSPNKLSKKPLKLGNTRTKRKVPGPQHLGHQPLLVDADYGLGKWDEL